jgi:hypothetical protein
MGLLKGSMTIRRYEILDEEPPDDFLERYTDVLSDKAFNGTLNVAHESEYKGWTLIRNFLETDFSDSSKWYFEGYIFANFRIDKKKVPAKLFRAKVQQEMDLWKEEQIQDKVPGKVRAEIKERISIELLVKILPTIKTVEWCWNIVDGYVLFYSTSNSVNDAFLVYFYETFGIALHPSNPLYLLEDEEEQQKIQGCELTNLSYSKKLKYAEEE